MPLLVLYAKVVDDKEIGVLMTGIFVGGVADSSQEADEIARKCVSTVQGGMAITRISPLINNDFKLTLKAMAQTFERLADRMYESERTTGKGRFTDS